MPRLVLVLGVVIATTAAATAQPIARDGAPPVCAALAAAAGAPLTPTSIHKAFLRWWHDDQPHPTPLVDVVRAGATELVAEGPGSGVLAVVTDAQAAALAQDGVMVESYLDALDDVRCGSLAFHAPPQGPVTATVALPARWRSRADRASYCVQVAAPSGMDGYGGAVYEATGDPDVPMFCDATCAARLTTRQAAIIARQPWVRGVWRREPAFALDASLACPDLPEAPIAPAQFPAFLAAVMARPAERITVTVTLAPAGGSDQRIAAELAAAERRLAALGRVVARDGEQVTMVVARRRLPAIAAIPTVATVARSMPVAGPTLGVLGAPAAR